MDINKALDNAEHVSKSIYYDFYSKNYIPSSKEFKDEIHKKLKGNVKNHLTFIEFFKEFIERADNNKSKSTIDDYRYTLNSLIEFSSIFKTNLSWDTFDKKLYDDYMSFQFNYKKNSGNLFGKRIKVLKTVLNNAVEYGYIPNLNYKKYKVIQIESGDDIYLTNDEIKRIATLELDKLDLIKVRDLFLVGCYTGLRYSDIEQLDKENIRNNQIRIRCEKTNNYISTIIVPKVLEIFKKYNYCLPKIHSNIVNKKIKEIGKMAGINSIEDKEKFVGLKRIVTKVPKYELISTHTFRRSFITNLYKNGANTFGIMSVSGHKKESTFLRYVKLTKKESLKELSDLITT